MKLEDQVVSQELAKTLKELGVKQESYFVWVVGVPFFDGNHNERDLVLNPNDLIELTDNCSDDFEMASAFTVAELGEMLPKVFDWTDGRKAQIATGKSITTEFAVCGIFAGGKNERVHQVHADTEADARAKMLVYLIERDLVHLAR